MSSYNHHADLIRAWTALNKHSAFSFPVFTIDIFAEGYLL